MYIMVRNNGGIMKEVYKNKPITACYSGQMLKRVQHDKIKVAFTLAETLIAMAIIGIIVAIVLPILVKNVSHLVLKNQFKQTYAELNVLAKNFYVNENMSIPEYVANVRGNGSSWGYNNATPKIRSYFRNTSPNDAYWFRAFTPDLDLPGNSIAVFDHPCSATGPTFKDNTKGRYYGLGAGRPDSTLVANYKTTAICVDINGEKKPNKWGYDRFAFLFTKDNKVVPCSDSTCTSKKTGCSYSGGFAYCAKYALMDKNPNGNGNYWLDFLK